MPYHCCAALRGLDLIGACSVVTLEIILLYFTSVRGVYLFEEVQAEILLYLDRAFVCTESVALSFCLA